MMYADYVFELYPGGIIFDRELYISKTPYKGGEYFRAEVGSDGQLTLKRVYGVEEFLVKGEHENVQKINRNNSSSTSSSDTSTG